MRVRNYEVRIPQGFERTSGHVEINHRQEYQLQLTNNGSQNCEAAVFVDGKNIGTWIINRYDTVTLERPANVARKFTFLETGSSEFSDANLDSINRNDLGLIKVKFTPERNAIPCHSLRKSTGYRGAQCSLEATSYNSGGTGLGSNSNQQFREVNGLNLDHSKSVTINLRLVTPQTSQYAELPRVNSNPEPYPV